MNKFESPDFDLGRAFENLVGHCFISYSGCIIETSGTKFKYKGISYDNLTVARQAVDQGIKNIGESIKNEKTN